MHHLCSVIKFVTVDLYLQQIFIKASAVCKTAKIEG